VVLNDLFLGGRPRGRLTGSSGGGGSGGGGETDLGGFFGGRPRGRFNWDGVVVTGLVDTLFFGGLPLGLF